MCYYVILQLFYYKNNFRLKQLKKYSIHHNKNLEGFFPRMASKEQKKVIKNWLIALAVFPE